MSSEDGGVSVLRRMASGNELSLLTIRVAPLTVLSRSRATANGENFRWTVPAGTVRAAEFVGSVSGITVGVGGARWTAEGACSSDTGNDFRGGLDSLARYRDLLAWLVEEVFSSELVCPCGPFWRSGWNVPPGLRPQGIASACVLGCGSTNTSRCRGVGVGNGEE